MTEEQIKEMARRFLQWKLPDDFHPDGGISFKAAFNEHTAHPVRHEPVGTNLLTFAQAVEMVRHMVAALEAQPAQEPVAHWYTGPTEEQATAALRAKLAEVERERDELQTAIDSIETSNGLTSNGSMWRFWCGIANEHLAARKAAEAHLTALLRAEYERGVRESAEKCTAVRVHADTTEEEAIGALICASDILGLLTQEGR